MLESCRRLASKFEMFIYNKIPIPKVVQHDAGLR